MKKLLLGTGVFLLILTSLASFTSLPTQTQSKKVPGHLDFTFVNHTGVTLYAFFTSETKDNKWGEDLLPEDLVENDDEVDVTFEDDDDGDCHWDVKVSLDADDTKFWYVRGIDMCVVEELTFLMENGVCVYKVKKAE